MHRKIRFSKETVVYKTRKCRVNTKVVKKNVLNCTVMLYNEQRALIRHGRPEQ